MEVKAQKPLLLERRDDITLEVFETVAWRGRSVQIAEAAKDRMAASRRLFLDLLEDPEITIYGVTTGYGQMAKKRLSPDQRKAQAAAPPVAPATAFGELLPERVVRGILLARLANYLDGHAAVSPGLAEAVAAMFESPLPQVSAEGVGSAGDIQPLAELFVSLGEKHTLGEKESLALVNGSPCAAALLADAVLAAKRRMVQLEVLFALSIEAILAPLGPYDRRLGALWQDPHEAAVLESFARLLEGGTKEEERRPYQAPVSWRVLPRVLGQARRAVAQAEDAARISLSAVSDNPVFLPPDDRDPKGKVVSTGAYHNGKAGAALDAMATSWADLAILADRQATKLLDGEISRLPPHLVSGGEEQWPRSGYIGCLAMTAAAWSEAARRAPRPSLILASEGGGFGQNDVAPATFFAYRQQCDAAAALGGAMACLATIASQAFHVTGRNAPPQLSAFLEEIRQFVPPLEERRVLGPEVGALAAQFAAQAIDPDTAAI